MPTLLHTHSWYSLLEGTSGPEVLLARAMACGYTALALTDTNNLYGMVPFTEQAHQHGIRPLLGACLRQQRLRCVALVADHLGYRNLCRILSRLHLGIGNDSGLVALLRENNEGLHVLVSDLVLAERLREAFGSRLWLEVIRPAARAQGPLEAELLEEGRRLGLRPVASTATHFAQAAEHETFRLVTAVRLGILLDRLPRQLALTPEHHLVNPEELRRRFHDLPEAVRNTDILAEQLRSDVLPRDVILPPARVPRHVDAVRYLRLLCERGLRRRDLGDSLAARERLRRELAVIEAADLSSYFLVVRDIARYARRRGHGMALRGSAGNSLVCFLLEITDVDPLRFGLEMERFLHPGRTDLPDIDLDFDWKVRDAVMAHVVRRWGPAHTAQISSHLFLQPRSAFREAAKLHGLSNDQVSELLTQMQRPGSAALDAERPPPGFPLEVERWPRLVRAARLLLGRPHYLSLHPGGIVITPRPLEDHVPLQRAAKGVVMTQLEKDGIEHIGLVKIDLLGNRGLATMDEARLLATKAIAHGLRTRPADTDLHGKDNQEGKEQFLAIVSSSCRVNPCPQAVYAVRGQLGPESADAETMALLRRGDTLGINQMESPAMRHLLVQLQPRHLGDVVQAMALIRPAAALFGMKERFLRRRRGLEPVRHAHPALAELLGETQGLLLYEDDALRVIQVLTGLAPPEADRFRKRVARHRTEDEARKLGQEFAEACQRNGVGPDVAAQVWPLLARFNLYSFCKSHAVSYSLIGWEAAWLKAHFPLCFWTAVLNNNQGMYPRRVYVEALKRVGLTLRLPCVNRSEVAFTVEDAAMRTGLGAIATLAQDFRLALLDERQRHGPYHDLADLRRRVRPGPEALALLIRCGALDFTGQSRPALFLEADLQEGQLRAERGHPSPELFPWIPDWSPRDYTPARRLHEEWQLLGFVLGPPLLALFRPGLPEGLVTSRELPEHVGRRVQVAGVVATARDTLTRTGGVMQFVTLEDEWGFIEVTLFPGTCPPLASLTLGPYLTTGRVEEQYGVITLTAHTFQLHQSSYDRSNNAADAGHAASGIAGTES